MEILQGFNKHIETTTKDYVRYQNINYQRRSWKFNDNPISICWQKWNVIKRETYDDYIIGELYDTLEKEFRLLDVRNSTNQ